jgi:hypothetical protein
MKKGIKRTHWQFDLAESYSANDCDSRRFDYFLMVNPKGLDGLVAKGKVDPNMVGDLLSELYDLDGKPLHGLRTVVFERLRRTYPDLTRDRCYQLLARLIESPRLEKSSTSRQKERAIFHEKMAPDVEVCPRLVSMRKDSKLLVIIKHYR